MNRLNLNQTNLKELINNWNDHSKIIRPLVIIKVSEAFTMYHEMTQANLTVENRVFRNLHPVLINDLETHFSIILALDSAGRMVHAYLIKHGRLERNDDLLKFAYKNQHQEYLDYFYCISKNIQRHLDDHADSLDK